MHRTGPHRRAGGTLDSPLAAAAGLPGRPSRRFPQVFGSRRRKERAQATAREEEERRALLAELAKRPDTVCPFLGLAESRAEYQPEPTGEHRCYAFGDPAALTDEQQRNVCLERGYSNCPRYLRGVLVIPTEELEALRHPQAPAPRPTPAPEPTRRRRRAVVLVPLLLVLIAAVGAGGWYLLNQNNPTVAIVPTPTPTPVLTPAPTPVASEATPEASAAPSTIPSPSGLRPTPTPEPTPAPNDHFDHYEVGVGPVHYTLYIVDRKKGITGSREITFGDYSRAPVVPKQTVNGLVYWETSGGGLTGYSYIPGRSGDFQLREVFFSPDGKRAGVLVIPPSLATVVPSATPAPR